MGLRQHEGNCNPTARPHIAHAFPEATKFSWRLARRSSRVLGADLFDLLRLLLSESEERKSPALFWLVPAIGRLPVG